MIKKISNVLFTFGFILIIISIFFTVKHYLNINNQTNHIIVNQLYDLMPQIQNGIILNNTDEMPIVELDSQNFVGVINVPKFNCTLPICALWDGNNINKYPSLYLGTIYDGSIIIGTNDQKNQFDFTRMISEDDFIIITDMKGRRFSYIVEFIEITKDISTKQLLSKKNDLIIFVENNYTFDYTILRCNYRITIE